MEMYFTKLLFSVDGWMFRSLCDSLGPVEDKFFAGCQTEQRGRLFADGLHCSVILVRCSWICRRFKA